MKMKKLILLALFIVAVSSTAAASYSLTVTAENSEGGLVTADEICVSGSCVEREFSHTFSVSENQDATITIQDSEYDNLETSEYVFADMEKTYTLQQPERENDEPAELTVEAINEDDEYVTADKICVNNNCIENAFDHTFEVPKNEDAEITIQDSEYDSIEQTEYIFADTTKTYTLQQTQEQEDENVELTVEAVNEENEYVTADEICVENNCAQTEFSHTVQVQANQDVSITIEDSEYDNIERSTSISSDQTKTYELTRTEDDDSGPTASFSIDDINPNVEQWVNFDASDSSGDIENYNWDFGDGDTYTDDDPKVSHRYNNEGKFTVELTVEEQDGEEDTTTKTLDVERKDEENSAPVVDLNRPSNNQEINLPYSFRWDVSDPDNDDVESIIYIGEERDDESTLDDEYLIREDVGNDESFRLYISELDEGEYIWGVEATDDEASTFSDVRSFQIASETDREEDENGNVNVFVEDSEGDPIEEAKVTVDNENWFSQYTDNNGEASFEVQPGNVDITASKDGYRTKTQRISIDSGEDRDISFTLRDRDRDDDPDRARLTVHVEDDDYDNLEDAKVTVENGEDEIKYTNQDGDARFYLDSDDYDIEVECNSEEEYREVYLSEGERETIDIRFDEEFNSDVCGEEDEDTGSRDDTNEIDEDRDDTEDGEGLAIRDVTYPNSVCRGGSFSVDMSIENRGGFHELVTVTGSGLGSINVGQNFALDIGETKSASVQFTNVEGSGTEEFDIRATNHVSDENTETINVRDCGDQIPDTDGEDFSYDSGSATGVTAEVSPKKTVVGKAVKVKGYVDGFRGRSQVTIRANSDRKGTVSTEPDGYYSTYIRLDEIGDNIIRVSSASSETSSVVEVVPTSTVSGISAPNKVFESDSFEVCSNVDSQIEPKVFLLKNNKIMDSKIGNGEVCFETEASETGEHDYQIKALTYGKESSSPSTSVDVLELGSEVTNFPDKVATTESEEGMVKVDLYNTHNETRNYKVTLNGIRTTWLSQSQKEVFLTKGERETVYFYLTPEEEGNFEPTITVVSQDTTIYSEEVSVYAGGTKTPRKTSFFGRLSQIFSL